MLSLFRKKNTKTNEGFSLIETLIGIGILVIAGLSIFALIDFTLKVLWENKARAGAQALANQRIEAARNLTYDDVGTIGGIPSGTIEPLETIVRNNIDYTVATAVIFIDDSFDGTLGGVPDDLLPADYKRVRVEISWPFRVTNKPIVFLSDVAPRGIESEAGGGTIRISVLDAAGLPVPQADIHIENTDINPQVNVNLVANNNGQVILPGALAAVESYDVVVTKSDFSTDQTYEVDPINLPTPIKPPLTVAEGQVTDATFAIDLLASMTVKTVLGEDLCSLAYTNDRAFVFFEDTSDKQFVQDESQARFRIAASNNIYVAGDTGSDTTGDGSPENSYQTLIRALQDVVQGQGDVIHLKGGLTYAEGPVLLDNTYSGTLLAPTTIQSWTGTATATVQALGNRVFDISDGQYITLSRLELTDATQEAVLLGVGASDISVVYSHITGSGTHGISDQGSSGFHKFQNNTIDANTGNGIDVNSSSQLTIQENIIHGNTFGIYLASSVQNTIDKNIIYQNSQDGIFVNSSNDNDITNNVLYDNGDDAIEIQTTYNLEVLNNNIYNHFLGDGVYIQNSDTFVTIQWNTLHNNQKAISLVNSDDAYIFNNLIYENTVAGITLVTNSTNIELTGNTIVDNAGDGIFLDNASLDNIISDNIISGNMGWGLRDADDASEPQDKYNLFYANTIGDMQNLTPIDGGLGTLTGIDPLFVDAADDNYHLQSIKGYYPFGIGDVSTEYSGAIDLGEFSSVYALEPLPNGCRVNMGAYGNTIHASKSREKGDTIPYIPFILRGSKLIGYDGGGAPVYKYNQSLQTDDTGMITLNNMEWDSYIVSVDAGSTGYDINYIDPYQPVNVLPNTNPIIEIGLVTDTQDTLHVTVIDVNSAPLAGVQVRLENAGLSYDATNQTPPNGQVFFTNLSPEMYNLEVGMQDFATTTVAVTINGYTSWTTTLTADEGGPPLTPPDPPSSIAFPVITDTNLLITWNDNSTNEDGYKVYHNTSGTKPETQTVTLAANTESYPLSSLLCATQYFVWVEAFNSVGSAVASASETTSSCPSPPDAPEITGFSNITETTMDINWTDHAINEDEYRVYWDVVDTKPGSYVTLSTDSVTYPATGLTCNTPYYWWVEAINLQGSAEDTAAQSTNACAPTLVFYDQFTESSNTTLLSHIPDLGTGWTRIIEVHNGVEFGDDHKLGIHANSGQLRDLGLCGKSDGVLYQTNDVFTGTDDYEVSVVQLNGDTNDDYNILAARIQNAQNMYVFKWNESDGQLYKRVAGSWQTLGSSISGAGSNLNDGSTITLKVEGTTLSVIDDGNTLISVTDSAHASAGRAGVGMGAVITGTDDCSRQRLDNFSVMTN